MVIPWGHNTLVMSGVHSHCDDIRFVNTVVISGSLTVVILGVNSHCGVIRFIHCGDIWAPPTLW